MTSRDLRADLLADLAGTDPLPGAEPLPRPEVRPPPAPTGRRTPAVTLAVTPLRWARPRRAAGTLVVGPVSLSLTRS